MEHKTDGFSGTPEIKFGLFYFQMLDICEQRKCTFAESCRLVKEMGFDSVETDMDQVTEDILHDLADHSLSVSNIYCILDFEKEIGPRIEKLLKTVARINPQFVMMIPQKDNTPELKERIFPCLRKLQKQLAEMNVQMMMEDFDGPEKTFASLSGLLEYSENVPGMKICFDTGNFYYSGEDLPAAYERLSKDVVHIHCKDRRTDDRDGRIFSMDRNGGMTSHSVIGEGFLPLKEFFKRLLEHGYHGVLVAEHACSHDQINVLKRSIANMQKWCKSDYSIIGKK